MDTPKNNLEERDKEESKVPPAKEYELKTMKRDLARIRLSQAEEERKRIIGLQKKTEEKKEKEKEEEKEKPEAPPAPPSPDIEKQEPESLTAPMGEGTELKRVVDLEKILEQEAPEPEETIKEETEEEVLEPEQEIEEETEEEVPEPEQEIEEKKAEELEKKLQKKEKLIDEKIRIQEELAALKEEERKVNKRIQEMESEKSRIENETEKQKLEKKQEKRKEQQRGLQRKATEKREKLKKLEQKSPAVRESDETKELKKRAEEIIFRTPEEKQIGEIERAKRRLRELSKTRREHKEKEELKFKESLEERWKSKPKPKTTLPDEVREPVSELEKYPVRAGSKKRNWVRVLIGVAALASIVLASLFIYWFFFRSGVPSVTKPPVSQPPATERCIEYTSKERCEQEGCFWYEEACHDEQPDEEQPDEEQPLVAAPQALIPVDETKTRDISSQDEIREGLESVLSQQIPEREIHRLLFRNTTEENRYIGLNEFFNAFGIEAPNRLEQELEDAATFFLYNSGTGIRLGIVAEVDNGDNAYLGMKQWEETIENDTDELLLILGKQDKAGTNIFQIGEHRGVYLRYLSFPGNDFGICWTIYKGRFVLTTSGSSIVKTIDLLEDQYMFLQEQDAVPEEQNMFFEQQEEI